MQLLPDFSYSSPRKCHHLLSPVSFERTTVTRVMFTMLEGGWLTVALSLGWPLDNPARQNWEVCLGLGTIPLPPSLPDHKIGTHGFFAFPVVLYLCAKRECQRQMALH